MALTELSDGATLVWRRPSRELTGVIKPVSAFRDDEGRVCRHLIYSLSLGTYVRQVEGIACRGADGNWSLSAGLSITSPAKRFAWPGSYRSPQPSPQGRGA